MSYKSSLYFWLKNKINCITQAIASIIWQIIFTTVVIYEKEIHISDGIEDVSEIVDNII